MKTLILIATLALVSSFAKANILGTDFQNFNPTYSGLDFVTVHSSETLEPGVLNFGVFLNKAWNTLPLYQSLDENSTRSRGHYSDSVTGMDLNFGLGLTKNWDFGVNFPYVVDQSIDSDVIYGQFKDRGNTEVRVNTKYRFFGDKDGGLAMILSANFNLVNDNPYTGAGAGPTTNLEFAADTTWRKFALGANIGHRWRNPGTPINSYLLPMQNSAIASVAASYLLTSIDTKLIFEIYGSVPTQHRAEISDKGLSNLEALLGFKHDFTTDLAWHAGVTTEMMQGTASPDFRVYTGLNYTMGPLWGKDDDTVIPSPPTPTNYKKEETIIIYNINFETGSYKKVYGNAQDNLARLANYCLKPPAFKKMVITGHTDSVGSDEYNLVLSKNRAEAIKDYLVKIHGLDADKIEIRYYGESRPIADNGNWQGRKKNRRTEFTIYR